MQQRVGYFLVILFYVPDVLLVIELQSPTTKSGLTPPPSLRTGVNQLLQCFEKWFRLPPLSSIYLDGAVPKHEDLPPRVGAHGSGGGSHGQPQHGPHVTHHHSRRKVVVDALGHRGGWRACFDAWAALPGG